MVAYTGTHDNDTTVGWWNSQANEDSTRSAREIDEEREFTRRYLRTDGSEIHWTFIETIMGSVADTVLIPLQDVLGLGLRSAHEYPGRPDGNWQWRFRADALTPAHAARLRQLATLYDR
jgi:4-alpha-glucanotransferase